MPKYLVRASYTTAGIEGVRSKGGSSRRDALSATISGLGGEMESFYFAFGEDDVYVVAELPDDEAAAAIAITAGAAGGVSGLTTTVLLTPEQIDTAAQRSVEYTPPGG